MASGFHTLAEAVARFVCPICGGMLAPDPCAQAGPVPPVRCLDCEHVFPIDGGVLDLVGDVSPPASRIRVYPYGGAQLDFYGFFEELLRLGAYRDTNLDEEVFALLAWLDPDPGSPILLLGCGRGELALVLARAVPDSTIVACDDSLPDLAQARSRLARQRVENVLLVRCDLDRPPLRPSGFSSVLHFGLLHALPDGEDHMARLAPALPPGGRLAGMTLARSNLEHVARSQDEMSAGVTLRWVPIERLGRSLMKRGWVRVVHEQPSNWMARFQAIRGPALRA